MSAGASLPAPGQRTDHTLPETTQKVLLYVADLLRSGYTGRLELECAEGGIRAVRYSGELHPADLDRRGRRKVRER